MCRVLVEGVWPSLHRPLRLWLCLNAILACVAVSLPFTSMERIDRALD